MTELGKAAKHMGHQHPRVLRWTDPVPERATPAAKPHRKVEKPFGFSYAAWNWWGRFAGENQGWKREYEWFKTEAARDQAMRAFAHKFMPSEYRRDLRAERRSAPRYIVKSRRSENRACNLTCSCILCIHG